MISYKLNLQLTYSHQNIGCMENDNKVLLEFHRNKKDNSSNYKNLFEFDEKELDSFIFDLKEIYIKIKI